jgi:hypothetical protein
MLRQDRLPELQKRMADTDSCTTARLRVQKYGWPARDLVGFDGAAAAMTMVQHVPPETQRQVLPLVEAAFHAGTVRGGETPTSSITCYSAKANRSGMALWRNRFRRTVVSEFFPIDDEAHGDERRAEVGLRPLAEHRDLLRRIYFPRE